MPIDETNARLLGLVQAEIPLVDRPFEAIGARLGMAESEVIDRLHRLQMIDGVVRQVSAIFDSRSLGYQSCLVAAKVSEENLERAVAEINRHPGVSHNYLRGHAYNVWYTLAVPPDSTLGLERTVKELHERSGAVATRLMPALKVFKIGVKFDLTGETADAGARGEVAARFGAGEGTAITEQDKCLIRVLQQNLPIEPRPFDEWALSAGVTTSALLRAAKRYQESGVMRRFSAVLRHRKAGFGANAMGAWVVPPGAQESFGAAAATFAAVSHCYLRPSYPPDWPYSIFTMVHGRGREECEAVLAEISRATGVTEYAALYSTREFKKVRVKYFTPDIEAWERQHEGVAAAT